MDWRELTRRMNLVQFDGTIQLDPSPGEVKTKSPDYYYNDPIIEVMSKKIQEAVQEALVSIGEYSEVDLSIILHSALAAATDGYFDGKIYGRMDAESVED